MMWYSNGNSWVGWLVMSLMMLIFWGGFIALVVWFVRQPYRQGDEEKSPHKSPTTILEERFARGDIDEQEFHKRRDTLLASDRK
jgi:putative membrane protein